MGRTPGAKNKNWREVKKEGEHLMAKSKLMKKNEELKKQNAALKKQSK